MSSGDKKHHSLKRAASRSRDHNKHATRSRSSRRGNKDRRDVKNSHRRRSPSVRRSRDPRTQGCIEQAFQTFQQEQQHQPNNEETVQRLTNDFAIQCRIDDPRRVWITNSRQRRPSVNLIDVFKFCTKFCEVVKGRLHGSGTANYVVIEFREASEARACVEQRECDSLRALWQH